MSDFLDIQTKIINKIETLAANNHFSAYDGSIPTGEKLKSINGRYLPYVVYALGGKSEVRTGLRGIVSSREDLKWTSLVLYCVGDTPATVRKLKDVIRNAFEGYSPSDTWGEFVEILTGDFGISKPDADLLPLRYGETLAFKILTDD